MSIFADILGQPGPRKRTLQRAMIEIGKVGAGVIVLLMPDRADVMSASASRKPDMDLRSYGIGAQILSDLGIHDMILLTNSHRNVIGLDGYGINIIGERPIPEA
jgi:3,4-dihydroxy 2-butanone 4-phosphate synthase / GTP cyclohydrolase II